MTDDRYSRGKIYRLVSTVDEEFYVGSTCLPLAKRLYNHKSTAKQKTSRRVYEYLNKVGWYNVDIVLVELYPCDSKMELERRERYWIETLKPSLNKSVPTRTVNENGDKLKTYHTEYMREWRFGNPDNVRKANEKYYKDNKDKELDRCAKYREANRDAINARMRERRAKQKTERDARKSI